MISVSRLEYLAGMGLNVSPRSVKATCLSAGAVALTLFSALPAHAQCAAVGLNPAPSFPTQTAVTTIAGASAYLGTLVSSIQSVNTAFLAQSAFVAAPADPQPNQPGGGVWARAVGGHLKTGTTATAGYVDFGGPVAGNVVCITRTQGDFAGVQIGADVARLNLHGWNLHAGSTIGYFGSKTRDITPAGVNPPPSFRDELKVPFVGVYIAASYGGFLADAQVRGSFYQNEVSDENHGMFDQRFDARGISMTANVAYHHALAHQWFVEPSAGIVWSRTEVDSMSVPGTLMYGSGGVPPWVLAIEDIQSTLGRLSVRVGRSVTLGNVALQPFASVSVFHEFQGGATAVLMSDFAAIALPPATTLSSTVSIDAPKTYGQFGLGAAAQVADTGWVSYLRWDYRTGEKIEGWSVNGGLRYYFVQDLAQDRARDRAQDRAGRRAIH